MSPDILQIAYGESHSGFSRCYKIVTCFWYIQGLTKLLKEFIWHCSQCLQLQIRRHRLYGFLQPIESPLVPFFTLTLDFILAFRLIKQGFNVIMPVICKFSKQVAFIKGADTWSVKQWVQAFLKQFNLIDWGLPGVLITDQDPKFLSKFWAELYTRLRIKLLYSTAYHLQTDGSSKCTNQIVKIVLQFFVHALKNHSLWPKILLCIQFILNNKSFLTVDKTSNKVAYGFFARSPLDLLLNPLFPNTSQACTNEANAISFVFANQKGHYN